MPYKFSPFTGTLDFYQSSGSGDVVGPASATDNAIARYDGTTGKLIQNSLTIVQDGGGIEAQGYMTRRSVTALIKINSGQSWIAPSIELEPSGSIEIDPDAEIIIV